MNPGLSQFLYSLERESSLLTLHNRLYSVGICKIFIGVGVGSEKNFIGELKNFLGGRLFWALWGVEKEKLSKISQTFSVNERGGGREWRG